MNSTVLKIKERLSIVDVVSSYLTIEKAGKNYKAKCPFHNEKTPSFSISPDRGIYYCFGCGAKGDIFSFVEHFEGTDFVGALKILAEKAGVDLSNYQSKTKDKNNIYYDIIEEATSYYEKMISLNDEARSYLLERGLNLSSIKNFRIGYAPPSWTSIFDHLTKKGFNKKDIEIVGLVKQKDNRYYDRFRSRVMFPISDSSGRIIAFSGRVFKSPNAAPSVVEEAKYINSPDTPLFNKSDVLFGLDKAKGAIRSRNYSIVVEGQMDLILSHQTGFNNTVAVSGTAFSDTTGDELKINNLGLIRRLSPNIIFAYDGDEAGTRAVNRSVVIALSLGMQVKVAVVPKGKDPADIIFEDLDKWKDIIKNSINIISFHLMKICQNSNDLRTRGKKIREVIFPFLVKINSSIEKSAYINEIYIKTGLSEKAIMEDYFNYEKTYSPNVKTKINYDKNKEISSRRNNLEKNFFGIVFWKKNDPDIVEMVTSFKEDIGEGVYKKMLDSYEPFSDNLSFEAEMWYGDKINGQVSDLKEIILNLEEEIFKEEASVIRVRINNNEQNNNKEDINTDLVDYQKLVEKIESIKNLRVK